METTALRPCPFCAHDKPFVAAVGRDAVERVAVVCPECGAVGPMATVSDPPGHAAHLWNSRYGANVSRVTSAMTVRARRRAHGSVSFPSSALGSLLAPEFGLSENLLFDFGAPVGSESSLHA